MSISRICAVGMAGIVLSSGLVFDVAISAIAQAADVHGIVDTGAQCLLGASKGGEWLSAEAAAPSLTEGQIYRLVGLHTIEGAASGSAAKSVGDPCEDTLSVTLVLPSAPQEPMIGVGAPTWPLQPRPVVSLPTDNPGYVDAVRHVLVGHGIPKPSVRLRQVIRTDLDGNGSDEVLIAAARYSSDPPDSAAESGDYAVVLLRQIVDGAVTTSALHEEYYKGARDDAAPAAYEIAAIADLNGDGVMEVVVRGRYYEGEWADMFSYEGARFTKRLTCGCGL